MKFGIQGQYMGYNKFVPRQWLGALLAGTAILATVSVAIHAQASSRFAIAEHFANSDFIFQRGQSNTAFPPLAYISSHHYNDFEVIADDQAYSFNQTNWSQGAVLPWLISSKDALFLGEWVSLNQFDSRSSDQTSFSVTSIGIPLGWIRQVNTDWQAAAFAFPMRHKADLPSASWSNELMAGGFARYVQSETLWWGMGVFVDLNAGGNLYLPYLGLSWELNTKWTLSALMPWPALIYAPSKDWELRFGVSPSDTTWARQSNQDELYFDWGGWDFGITAQKRIFRALWLSAELGYTGFSSLSLTRGQQTATDIQASDQPYFGLQIDFRPSEF